ncbi:1-acyl-sn-glycerol-3-phosphate acyltransferase [Candidatus Kaiserbacteria bacterium]|nr:1-acyl-sn-glycerol-3-phosphate acyltransferase [Candidatus Kaiserbacteria bacterium]
MNPPEHISTILAPLAASMRRKRKISRFFYWSPWLLQNFIWPIVRPLFVFFMHFDIRGGEHLASLPPERQGTVFASSHSSELDSIIVPAALPFLSPLLPMFYTSREWTFYKTSGWRKYFYGGLLFNFWGAHRLHSGKHDYETSLETHIELLKNGKSLCMFPDGRRLPEEEVGSNAHGGIGFLAWRTGAVVVPVRITGIYHMTLSEFLTRRRTARVAFGKPLYSPDLFSGSARPSLEDIKSATEKIVSSIRAL